MASPSFWDSQEKAQERVAERKGLIGIVKPLDEALKASDDLAAMLEMAEEDDSFAAEVPPEVERIETLLEELKLRALLNGPHDAAGAILTINARDAESFRQSRTQVAADIARAVSLGRRGM